MNEMRVSIIMPAHNSARYIEQAVDSVLAQTYQDWQLLAVNDGSTDDTPDILEKYAALDKRIILLKTGSPKPVGVAKARNLAINAATGRYIAFLDSDDWWDANKLEKQIRFMEKTGAGMTHHGYTICQEDGMPTRHVITSQIITYLGMLCGKRVVTSTVIIDASRYGKPFLREKRGTLGLSEDLACWLQLLRTNGKGARSLRFDATGYYRLTPGSLSSKKIQMARSVWNILREQEKLSFLSAAFCFFCYAIYSVLKRKFR